MPLNLKILGAQLHYYLTLSLIGLIADTAPCLIVTNWTNFIVFILNHQRKTVRINLIFLGLDCLSSPSAFNKTLSANMALTQFTDDWNASFELKITVGDIKKPTQSLLIEIFEMFLARNHIDCDKLKAKVISFSTSLSNPSKHLKLKFRWMSAAIKYGWLNTLVISSKP